MLQFFTAINKFISVPFLNNIHTYSRTYHADFGRQFEQKIVCIYTSVLFYKVELALFERLFYGTGSLVIWHRVYELRAHCPI